MDGVLQMYHSTCCFPCTGKLCKLASPYNEVVYPFLRIKETTKVLTQSLYGVVFWMKETTKLLTLVECMIVFCSGLIRL